MNQHDRMRDKTAFLEARRQEALGTTTSWFYAGVKAAEDWQALTAEPAKLVALTTLERDRIAVSCQSTQQVISATIDAMIAKNKAT